MSFRSVLSILSILSICAIVSGCLAPPLPTPFPNVTSVVALGDLYAKRREAIPDFKGRLTVVLSSPRLGRQSFHATWYSERGTTSLRGFNLFGQSLFQLTLSASEVSFVPARGEPLWWRRTNSPPEHPTLALLSFDLIDQVNAAGLPDRSDASFRDFGKMGAMFRLAEVRHPSGTALHQIEPIYFHLKKTERFDAAGQVESTLTFDDYRKIGTTGEGEPIDFPFFVKGETEEGVVTLTFGEVTPLDR